VIVEEEIRHFAQSLGFARVGFTDTSPFDMAEKVMLDRLEKGLLGGMPWFTADRVIASCRPRTQFPEAESLISLAMPYSFGGDPLQGETRALQGVVSRYAWEPDYHRKVRRKLQEIVAFIDRLTGRQMPARIVVDSGWLAERAASARAGVGWFGKNANILVPGHGSRVFLGEILLPWPLVPDQSISKDCGRCDLCLRACPTAALTKPYEVDSTRCVSFLTIEWKGAIPRDLRPQIGTWVFGCDACQDVCPWNRKTRPVAPAQLPLISDWAFPSLLWLVRLSEGEFRARFRGTALTRAKRFGLRRNAAIALGNLRQQAAVPALTALLEDEEPLLRGHAAWALGEIGGRQARLALERAMAREVDAQALWEIRSALGS